MEEGYDSYPQGGMDDYGGEGGHDNGGPPMDDAPKSGGRGRGRGRGRGGGEPVFSDAFMGSLGGMAPPAPEPQGGQFDDASSAFPMGDMGGGRGRGRGRGDGGRGRGRGDGGRGRGRGGGDDGRGPPGLFKQGDWTCPMCGNVNWERRSTCNMCQTSKPNIAGVGENRDGIGGGFNERQERGAATLGVEISEDGYDDFGRIIKKQPADRKAKEAAALARLKQTFGASSLSIVTEAQLPVSNPVTASTTDLDRRDDRDDRDRDRGRNGDRDNGRRDSDRGGERGRDRSRERRGGDRDDKYSKRDDDRGRDRRDNKGRRDERDDRGRERRDRSRSRSRDRRR